MVTNAASAQVTDPLVRYVPRVLAEWDRHAPGARWRSIDGTVALFDISGFTTLTEQLSLHGRIGAEQLTDLLDVVFGDMMRAGYERGGSLVKFGGDALLFLFTGIDHHLHACSAAVEMRSALRRHAQSKTVAGRAGLRVSIGIHSGALDLFRVGTLHHDLLLAGPVASEVVRVEAAAEPGEILVSDEVAAALPAGSTTNVGGGTRRLRWRTGRLDPPGYRPRLVTTGPAITESVPVGLRTHLAAGKPEPDHRHATVAFVSFTGVDELLSSEGPARCADELHRLVDAIQRAAADEEIVFLNSDVIENGGKVTLTAGVPYLQADDEGRMLRTVRSIADTPSVFDVRIGVQHGHMFAGDIGTEHRGSFTIMGDLVNVAARFMGQARPGGVLVDPSTLERSSTRFDVEGPFVLDLKGRREEAVAYELGARIGQRSRSSGRLPMTGRDVELGVVSSLLAEHGTLVVKGDRGMGKTRLIGEALSGRELSVLEVRGEPHATGTPYGAFSAPLRSWLGVASGIDLVELLAVAAPDAVPLAPLVADALALDVDATPEADAVERRFRGRRVAEIVSRLLQDARTAPDVIWMDDLHWMDGASLALALSLGEADQPWFSVLVARTEFDVPLLAGAEQLTLSRLSDDDVLRLIEHATEHSPLRPEVVRRIVARVEGNPFYVEEIVRLARTGADLDDVPENLDATVGAQIDTLPPHARRLVRLASVLGKTFEMEDLVAVANQLGLDVDADDLAAGALADVFERAGPGRVGFRHAIVRRVAYESLAYRRRSEVHRAAAAVLTDRLDDPLGLASVLAVHHFEGGEMEAAWRFGLEAARQAQARYANDEAADHYERAIAAGKGIATPEELVEALIALGDVEEQAGRFDDARHAYRRAERVGSAPAQRAHARYRRAVAEMRTGRYTAALRSITSGLAMLDASAEVAVQRARLTSLRASVRMAQWQPAVAAAAARTALDLAVDDADSRARAHLVLHWASVMLGEEGHAHGLEALEVWRASGDLDGVAHAANSLGGEAYFAGDWDEAVRWYRQAEEAFRAAGNDHGAAVTESNIGEVLVDQHRFHEAHDMLRSAVRVLVASGEANDTMFAQVQLARAHAGRGEVAQAIDLLAHVLDSALNGEEAFAAREAARHLAVIQARAGLAIDALETIERYEAKTADPLPADCVAATRAWALLEAGDRAGAARTIERGLVAVRLEGLAHEEATLLKHAQSMALDVDEADLRRADQVLAGLGVVG